MSSKVGERRRSSAKVSLALVFLVSGGFIPRVNAVQDNRKTLRQEVFEGRDDYVSNLNPYANLPLTFEANHGQADGRVRFISRGPGFTLFLTADEAVLTLKAPAQTGPQRGVPLGKLDRIPHSYPQPRETLRFKFVGANTRPEIEGDDRLAAKSNYFIGGDPERWHTGIPAYKRVRYRSLYPGVDLVYYGGEEHMPEYDLILTPGARPNAIQISLEGGSGFSIDSNGDLVIRTKSGDVRQRKPRAFQTEHGRREEVDCRYLLTGKDCIAFQLAAYDESRSVVIDPELVYSTFLGGSAYDGASRVAVDPSGNAYVVGTTASANFPTSNALQGKYMGGDSSCQCGDVFIMKINSSGSALIYSTYLGGKGADQGIGIAVDAAGNAYISGTTGSADFPLVNPIQSVMQEYAFASKLSAGGDTLVYSTYLGGGGDIAVDGSGSAYVAGSTTSPDFPTVNPIQPKLGGAACTTRDCRSSSDGFVTKLNATGTAMVYSTYLGGNDYDAVSRIVVDSFGNAYVAGTTSSRNFPTKNPLQALLNGAEDAFVAKINSAGTALVYSTYLGGSFSDGASDLAVDSSGNAYVVGSTSSLDLPLVNPLQATLKANYRFGSNAFVAELNNSGSALLFSSYLGGSQSDAANTIALDSAGYIYVAGLTSSKDFPLAFPIQSAYGGGNSNGFVTKLYPGGTALVYSTYLGGSCTEQYAEGVTGIAADSGGNAYVAGSTCSADFPIANAIQSKYGGGTFDGFVARISSQPIMPYSAYFPQVAVGGGFTTFLNMVNASASSVSATLTFFDKSGAPFPISRAQLSVPISVVAGGVQTVTANPIGTDDPMKTGWALVTGLTSPLSGVVTYELKAGNSITTAVGVLPSQPTAFATIPVNNDDSQRRYTGFAVANPNPGDLYLKLLAVDSTGQVLASVTPPELNPLHSKNQVARYLHEYIQSTLKFNGSLVLVSRDMTGFVAVALLQNQGLYTAIPVISAMAPTIPK